MFENRQIPSILAKGIKEKISIPNVSNGVVRPAVLFAYAPHRMQAMTAM